MYPVIEREEVLTDMKKIRIAIVGYGGMGSKHVLIMNGNDLVECAGTYDINPARMELAREHGIHTYASMDELLADPTVDVCAVAIPNDQHKDVCIRCMRAGKSVVCEKPVSLSSAQLQEMIDVSKECNVLFTVHQNRRWDADYNIMKKIFDDNTLGRVFCIESRVHGSRGIPGDWRNKKECGGGMVLDWGIHLFDQMFMMMGDRKVKSIYCKLSNVTNEDCDDGFKVLVEFEDDIHFHVEVGTSNFINLPRWYMLGENGSAVMEDWHNGKIVMVSDWEKRDAVPVQTSAGWTKTMAPRTADTITEYPLPEVDVTLKDYYKNIARTLNGEATQCVTHEQMLRDMRFMEACFYSAENNCVVTDFE